MPYIDQKRRQELEPCRKSEPRSPGELAYRLTQVALAYLTCYGIEFHTLNDIVGALENTKAEFVRRVVAPYEDQKIKENGDVYK